MNQNKSTGEGTVSADMLSFFKMYELIGNSDNQCTKKSKVGICRYCGKSESETTFKQETHLIPEFLGENDIFTFDECDQCNQLFGGYESHFANFIRPSITLLGIKGKKGVPMFHSRTEDRNEETRTILKHKVANKKELHIQSLDDYTINPETNSFTINFRKAPYIPINVFKSISKIGFSLLPNEFDHLNKQAFLWLSNRSVEISNPIPLAYIWTLKRKYFSKATARLYKTKQLFNDTVLYPEYAIVLCFANQVLQAFLPLSEEYKKVSTEGKQLYLNVFPGFEYDKIKLPEKRLLKCYNLSSTEAVRENQQISFSYKSAEIKIPTK